MTKRKGKTKHRKRKTKVKPSQIGNMYMRKRRRPKPRRRPKRQPKNTPQQVVIKVISDFEKNRRSVQPPQIQPYRKRITPFVTPNETDLRTALGLLPKRSLDPNLASVVKLREKEKLSLVRKGLEKGRQKGLEEGLKRGRDEGIAEIKDKNMKKKVKQELGEPLEKLLIIPEAFDRKKSKLEEQKADIKKRIRETKISLKKAETPNNSFELDQLRRARAKVSEKIRKLPEANEVLTKKAEDDLKDAREKLTKDGIVVTDDLEEDLTQKLLGDADFETAQYDALSEDFDDALDDVLDEKSGGRRPGEEVIGGRIMHRLERFGLQNIPNEKIRNYLRSRCVVGKNKKHCMLGKLFNYDRKLTQNPFRLYHRLMGHDADRKKLVRALMMFKGIRKGKKRNALKPVPNSVLVGDFDDFYRPDPNMHNRVGGKAVPRVPALYESQIDMIMQPWRSKGYTGVYCSDEIPILEKAVNHYDKMGFIMNKCKRGDPQDGSVQEHWVCVYCDWLNRKEICYIDSFAQDPDDDFLKHMRSFIESRDDCDFMPKLKINRIRTQRWTTDSCGFHAMRSCMELLDGKPFKEVTSFTNLEPKARKMAKRFGFI